MRYYITIDGTFGAADDVSFFETDNLPDDFADWTDRQRLAWVARPKVSAAAAGCWIDGHWGQYGLAKMVEIAAGYGFGDDNAYDELMVWIAKRHLEECRHPGVDLRITDDEHEILSQSADAVEKWLNDNVAPKGYGFGWHDGEFFLQAHDWWEQG